MNDNLKSSENRWYIGASEIYKSQEVGISAWVFLTRLPLSDLRNPPVSRRFQVVIRLTALNIVIESAAGAFQPYLRVCNP